MSSQTPQSSEGANAVRTLVEEIAGAIMMLDPKDRDALVSLGRSLEAVRAAATGELKDVAKEALELIAKRLNGHDDISETVVTEIGNLIVRMQTILDGADSSQVPVSAAPASLALPDEDRPVSQGPRSANRDGETVELFGDFLQEGQEGLDKVDEILMAVESEGLDLEKVNALFRVFHTIKGVSGFLELRDVTSLAHITESLLNDVREGKTDLSGGRLDVVFDSSGMMRRLLVGVRSAVESDTTVEIDAEVAPLVRRIEAAIHGAAAPAPPAAPSSPKVAEKAAVAAAHEEVKPQAAPAKAVAPPPDPGEHAPEPSASRSATPAPIEVRADKGDAPEGGNRPAGQPPGKIRETLKVDLERIDNVVEMIGELIIVESMVVNAEEIAALSSLKVRNYLSQLAKISRDLQNVAMRMRMVPVRGVFQKMARMVRELAKKLGKDIVLVQSGESAEMDRSMVERIEDPLVHMIRNAIDHAIEPMAERVAAGKTPQGMVSLSAYHEGGSIVIEIADDGRGLARDKILNKARAQGLIRDTETLSDSDVYALIFLPGFSTAAKVTEVSGRGVGMDVVKRNIEGMRGRVVVTSAVGKGTTFKLVLPLTLAIIDGMLVACGEERYIIPSLSIVESLQPTCDMIRTLADLGELINVRGEIMPLLRLHRLFHVPGPEREPVNGRVIIVESMGRKIGLVVDDVITQQQVVIKPLGSGMGDTECLSGAAILSDGRVGLILNVDRLGTRMHTGGLGGQWKSGTKEAAA